MFTFGQTFGSITNRIGGSGTPALPSGAMGIWYADEHINSPRPSIPNRLAATPVNPSLLGPSRRLYNNATFIGKSSVTITDNFAPSFDGVTGAASRYNGTADSYLLRAITLAPGTYTMCVWVKSNTGSSQNFRMRFFSDSLSSTKTATTSWQRFTFTAVTAGGSRNLTPIASADGVTALDLVFSDIDLYAGSSDLYQPQAGHIILGAIAGVGVPSYASGAVDMNSAYGVVQFPTPTTVSQFTTIAIVSKTNTGTSYQAWLSHIPSFSAFSAYMEQTAGASPPSGNPYVGSYGAGFWRLNGLGWQGIGHRYNGTSYTTWLNDIKIGQRTAAFAPVPLQDLWFASVNGFLSGYKIAALAIWNRTLTDEEYATAYEVLKARAAASSNVIAVPQRYLIAEGDSITNGHLADPYPNLFGPNASPSIVGTNLSVGSTKLSGNAGNSLDGRKAIADAIIPANKAGRMFIYTCLIGRNDGPSWGTPAAYAAAVAAHLADRRAAGYDKIILCTILPTGSSLLGGPEFNTWRNAVNAIWTAPGWKEANNIDAICDFAANATIGPDAAGENTSLFPDKVHPGATCYAIMEPIYRASVNSLN